LYYLSLTNQHPQPVIDQKEGVKWIYFVRDFISFLEKRRKKQMTTSQWIKGLSGKKVEALFSWDDPFPFIRSFISKVRNLWIISLYEGSAFIMRSQQELVTQWQKNCLKDMFTHVLGQHVEPIDHDVQCLKASRKRTSVLKLMIITDIQSLAVALKI